MTGFIQHIGGIHSGCAAAGIAWFFFLVIRTFQHHVAKHTPAVVLAWGIITLVVVNVVMFAATPWIRANHHKYVISSALVCLLLRNELCFNSFFERHHRFAGWGAVVFVWIFVCLADSYSTETGKFHSSGNHLVRTQEFWYALFITVL